MSGRGEPSACVQPHLSTAACTGARISEDVHQRGNVTARPKIRAPQRQDAKAPKGGRRRHARAIKVRRRGRVGPSRASRGRALRGVPNRGRESLGALWAFVARVRAVAIDADVHPPIWAARPGALAALIIKALLTPIWRIGALAGLFAPALAPFAGLGRRFGRRPPFALAGLLNPGAALLALRGGRHRRGCRS